MEQDIISIIEHWNLLNPSNKIKPENAKVRYADEVNRIYTLYTNNKRIKALPQNGGWKIINLK